MPTDMMRTSPGSPVEHAEVVEEGVRRTTDRPLPAIGAIDAASTVELAEQPLSFLAEEINASVAAAETHAKSALAAALRAGTLLIEAKQRLEHGHWENWLESNCTVAPRTARAYMRLARAMPLLTTAERQRVADLPVRDAVRAIATAPEAPTSFKPPRYQAKSPDEVERTVHALTKSAAALRKAAKEIALLHSLDGKKIAALRGRLVGAQDLLDQISGEGKAGT